MASTQFDYEREIQQKSNSGVSFSASEQFSNSRRAPESLLLGAVIVVDNS